MIKEILLIPEKSDPERDSVASVWKENGGSVLRVGKFWNKPKIEKGSRITIYGHDTFSLILAQVLNIELIIVDDDLIGLLPKVWTKRNIEIKSLIEINHNNFPYFFKPVAPKLFESKVYQSLKEFNKATEGINEEELIITSEIIAIKGEVRSFILNREIKDLALYEGKGDLLDAKDFINKFLSEEKTELPQTFVLDIGYNEEVGWFIIEFNSSWGAGLNFCKPEKIIDCLRQATKTSA